MTRWQLLKAGIDAKRVDRWVVDGRLRVVHRGVSPAPATRQLEDAFIKLLKAHELPLPRTNIDFRGNKVDCHWEAHGLTIELQSYGFHETRHGFETDITRRRSSNHLPFSYGDVVDRGAATAAELRERLDEQKAA